ncbi:MAG: D-tyrosyl-tRNA(Tyr) deacylase [Deltaproteobacteria bacterium]|nr:D-tyrosyl-tRNA(Tyr) deacylase [Deltaproteobacteria bacterium]
MRSVLQRVSTAEVTVAGKTVGAIGPGLLVLVGVEQGDTERDLAYLVDKTVHLRIFEDSQGKMNLSVQDVGGSILAVSQFTLLADCRQGRRPGFSRAAPPEIGQALYEKYVAALRSAGIEVATGVFGASMRVRLSNEGPVTILLDSREASGDRPR